MSPFVHVPNGKEPGLFPVMHYALPLLVIHYDYALADPLGQLCFHNCRFIDWQFYTVCLPILQFLLCKLGNEDAVQESEKRCHANIRFRSSTLNVEFISHLLKLQLFQHHLVVLHWTYRITACRDKQKNLIRVLFLQPLTKFSIKPSPLTIN